MIDFFSNFSYTFQAFVAALFTFGITSVGSAIVFCFKKVNKNILDSMLGLAAGVMIAASFWSLLSPAIDMAEQLKMISWFVVFIGFFFGGLLLFTGDKVFNYFDNKFSRKKKVNSSSIKRVLMVIFSITLHNIPEGMAIGVAFGSVKYGISGATITAAWVLALGIGIQNFPEGTAVSLPLRREGFSRKKAFLLGTLSGIVEPIASVIGCLLVTKVQSIMPFLLSFAAGAMIYVVVEELIPESQTNKKKDLMAIFTIVGFSLMMVLDIALS